MSSSRKLLFIKYFVRAFAVWADRIWNAELTNIFLPNDIFFITCFLLQQYNLSTTCLNNPDLQAHSFRFPDISISSLGQNLNITFC